MPVPGPIACVLLLLPLTACGNGIANNDPDASLADAADPSELPYAREVISFAPGSGAGYGQDDLPGVILGPPSGSASGMGALHVLSLGVGGEVILGFDGRILEDGAGPDLVVFENPFWIGGDQTNPFAELGEVAVSMDGETWTAWTCDTVGAGQGRWPDCAGWSPTLAYDSFALVPIDAAQTGGDVFDLADIGLTEARYVRIRDLATEGAGPSAGFDLDAVGMLYWR